jgi:hypothetical protein
MAAPPSISEFIVGPPSGSVELESSTDQPTGDADLTWKLRGSSVSDQSTRFDKLGFRPYVDAVAAFLLHPDTIPPLTMSVEGEWGTGKSSFMRQLKDELERERSAPQSGTTTDIANHGNNAAPKPVTFWFNAWRHDKQDAMWATFALSITKQMREQKSFVERIWGDLKLAVARIQSHAAWLHVATVSLFWLVFGGGALVVIAFLFTAPPDTRVKVLHDFSAAKQSASGVFQEAILPILAQITATHYWLAGIFLLIFYVIWFRKSFGKRLELKLAEYLDKPDYKNRAAFIEGFHHDFKRVIQAYAAKNRIFIFIDDLDRCDVPRAAELMQAINLMIGDDDHLVFILGMDREKIAAGITLKFKDLMPFLENAPSNDRSARHAASFGYSYLEKFIQITFRVPRPSESGIEEFLRSLGQSAADTQNDNMQKRMDEAIRRERRKLVEVRSRVDSSEVQRQVKLVAPALDWNPRRIKQFINDFRLQAYIASDLGLLDFVSMDDAVAASAMITLEQLGKFVAITQTWPDLVMDLIGYPGLLASLYREELDSSFDESDELGERQRNLVNRWAQQSTLIDLLLAKCGRDETSVYSLAQTDLRVLLNITPRVNRKRKTDENPEDIRKGSSESTAGEPSSSGAAPSFDAPPTSNAPTDSSVRYETDEDRTDGQDEEPEIPEGSSIGSRSRERNPKRPRPAQLRKK